MNSAVRVPRRTLIAVEKDDQFSTDDFIVDEDAVVLISREGWVKRQREVRDVPATRLCEGNALLAALTGSTRATCVLVSNPGAAVAGRQHRLTPRAGTPTVVRSP